MRRSIRAMGRQDVYSRRRITGTVAALTAAAGLLLATALPAGADPPVDSHNGGVVTIQCDELGQLDIGGTAYGEWTHAAEPMHVVGSNLTLLGYAFHYVFTPTVGDEIVVDGSKPAPRSGRLDRCVMRFSVPDPEGVFVGTYWVSYTAA
jgi:hypothetical protein